MPEKSHLKTHLVGRDAETGRIISVEEARRRKPNAVVERISAEQKEEVLICCFCRYEFGPTDDWRVA